MKIEQVEILIRTSRGNIYKILDVTSIKQVSDLFETILSDLNKNDKEA
jgi:hypothetical protein